ncbi:MAG TPA: trehalose-6-phosphate synthase, partial [Chromatiales bacterium]|nr:trehalose-6-phosphate synthase [Chromatiales bacterium]
DADDGIRTRQAGSFSLVTLGLSGREYTDYYLGFANRAVWPLFHGRTDLFRFDPDEFATYRAVNRKFARRFGPLLHRHDLVWIHDYHLFFLGQELRRLGTRLPLGYFLHIPFPAGDTLAALPCHRAIVEALLAYDLVGFQTENDVRNFQEFVVRHLDGAVSGDGTVFALGRKVRTGAFPIGIDTRQFEETAASEEVANLGERVRKYFCSRFGIIGVDRLDYTKGLAHRLRAFERFIEIAPRYRGRAFLFQIAAPSREQLAEYVDLKSELEAMTGRINARHSDVGWTPVRYLNQSFGQTCLAALYRRSRVGLVTPLRDGMNLVAKEYVAAQDPEDPGVLILSRFAGAAERLSGALLVNPHNIEGVATAMCEALEMPRRERRARWSEMIAELRKHDIHDWRDNFLRTLEDARRWQEYKRPPYPMAAISTAGRQREEDDFEVL